MTLCVGEIVPHQSVESSNVYHLFLRVSSEISISLHSQHIPLHQLCILYIVFLMHECYLIHIQLIISIYTLKHCVCVFICMQDFINVSSLINTNHVCSSINVVCINIVHCVIVLDLVRRETESSTFFSVSNQKLLLNSNLK